MKQIIVSGTNPEVGKREAAARALARRAAAEGMVLLKNDGALPVARGGIALYGSGARRTVKGGTGSGAMHERYSVGIEQGLMEAGYTILTSAWLDRFDSYYDDQYAAWKADIEEKTKDMQNPMQALGLAIDNRFLFPTGIPVKDSDISTETDTAIYVIARQAGEGNDRYNKPGDYQLDELELANLKRVSESYAKTIVVINCGGVMDLSFMDTMEIAGLVFFCQGGEEGGNAFADVCSGKVNPSGKLTDTWAYSIGDYPSTEGFSFYGDAKQQDYTEDIYVGYRYFDSFGVKPRYPFGFGLSYTSFAVSLCNTSLTKSRVFLVATVQNTGNTAGREVVQVYATVPFGSKGAEYQRLVGFAKTGEIQPGESETVTVSFDIPALASYDEAGARYVMAEGEYVLRLGNSSDNTVPVLALELEEDVVTETCISICPPQKQIALLQPPARKAESLAGVCRIKLQAADIPTIENEYSALPVYPFEETCEKIQSMTTEQLATLVVGGDTSGKRLVTAMGASGSTTSQLYEACGIPNAILSDGPAGLNLTPRVVETPEGELKTVDLYEQYNFGPFRRFMRSRMGKPEDGVMHYQYATALPASTLLAQTWDVALLEEIGRAVGAEMEAFGVTVWLAPGMNIHRNPLCGRVFEYYSEDPLVSGLMAAALTNGVQSHPGKGVSLKHFCANNSEKERNFSSSNLSERALREIYLKGFEIALAHAKPMTVMSAYNMVNGEYCPNSYDLLTKVLRNEWGFEGMVMSDWDSVTPQSGDIEKTLWAGCDLVMPGHPQQAEAIIAGVKEGRIAVEDLQRCASRVLWLVRQNSILASD